MFGLISGAIGVASGLKGLFGSKPKQATPSSNLLSQAKGARQAAEKYGFNPLTMLQYGQTGGAMGGGGGAPPLSSVQILTDGLRDVSDVLSGEDDRRRAREELETDLLRVQLDRARSGVIAVGSAADGIAGPSPLGRRTAGIVPAGSARIIGGASRAAAKVDNPNADHPLRASLGNVSLPDPTLDRGAGAYVGGFRLEPAPGWSSGEVIEQEYGETPLNWPYIGLKMGADLIHNVGRATTEAEAERLRKQGVRVEKIDGKYYVQEKSPLLPKGAKTRDVQRAIFGRQLGQ